MGAEVVVVVVDAGAAVGMAAVVAAIGMAAAFMEVASARGAFFTMVGIITVTDADMPFTGTLGGDGTGTLGGDGITTVTTGRPTIRVIVGAIRRVGAIRSSTAPGRCRLRLP